jgi:CubicO group peptidase (beta-lactamase class C family)
MRPIDQPKRILRVTYLRAFVVLAPLIGSVGLSGSRTCAQQPVRKIRRLDGSTISTTEAEAFAKRALEERKVTGAQVAVLNRGKLVWSAAFGLRGRDPDLPMNRETTMWAASITKSVFATYVMTLVERGEFQLDVPVAKQLEKPLDSYQAYKETGSAFVSETDWPLVTPRMLLSHTSGLLNFVFIEPDQKMHLHFKPGAKFNYSGQGINLVQFLIEQQRHQPIDQLMQEALFAPLEMKRTGLIYRQEFEADVADRFDINEKIRAKTRRFPARAAGSMTTSAEDLARFCAALLDDRILKSATRQAMLTPVVLIRTLHQFALKQNEGEGAEAASVGLAYGAGWGLLTKTRFGPAFFKEGHGDGAQNYMICFERSKSCMILLTNSDNGELAFRPLLERILGDTVTPWEWEGYSREYIEQSRKH